MTTFAGLDETDLVGGGSRRHPVLPGLVRYSRLDVRRYHLARQGGYSGQFMLAKPGTGTVVVYFGVLERVPPTRIHRSFLHGRSPEDEETETDPGLPHETRFSTSRKTFRSVTIAAGGDEASKGVADL
ncbi:hypothetical protein [Mesorhizobium sp. M0843]|uniref:hypothetical protein n=1 Tax=Mesorhizobium sp. M0843 TaxID=2957010 RepID=UPI003335176A